MYDLIIKNGQILDGTGSPAYHADVAIKDGTIVRIARGLDGAAQVIDATGLVVTPGFIDSHSHSDNAILTFPDQKEKVEQGITSVIGGQCGISLAPMSRDDDPNEPVGTYGTRADVLGTMGRFLDIAKNVPQGANIATFVGHAALRKAAMGLENRAPTPAELERMKELLRDAIRHGALGISLGLIYTPSCYAQTDELIELAKAAGECNALVAAHIRNERNTVAQATEEFHAILRASGARGIHSHHKAAQKENWGKVSHTLRMLDQANESGLDVYCDVYPYCASNTSLAARFIPKELHTNGAQGIVRLLDDADNRRSIRQFCIERYGEDLSFTLIPSCNLFPDHPGLRIPELAEIHGKDPFDTLFDIIQSDPTCSAAYFTMCEEDVERVLAHPRAMICTDSSVAGNKSSYHPRLRASFPRVLGRYVRERKVTSLPEMIRKMTSMPAAVYGLTGKGLLVEGMDADICIFDPDTIIDRADFIDPTRKAEGLNYVLVGGQIVVEDAVYNGKRMGKVLLRK